MIQLYPLENWRLLWYRKDAGSDPRCDAVQAFLMSSVLQDPNYRTISVFAEEFGVARARRQPAVPTFRALTTSRPSIVARS